MHYCPILILIDYKETFKQKQKLFEVEKSINKMTISYI